MKFSIFKPPFCDLLLKRLSHWVIGLKRSSNRLFNKSSNRGKGGWMGRGSLWGKQEPVSMPDTWPMLFKVESRLRPERAVRTYGDPLLTRRPLTQDQLWDKEESTPTPTKSPGSLKVLRQDCSQNLHTWLCRRGPRHSTGPTNSKFTLEAQHASS